MGKLERLDISFEHPHAVFTAGERILGHVILHLNEPMKMRNLRIWLQGRAKVHWSKSSGSGSNRNTTHYRAEEIYFEEVCYLRGTGNGESFTHEAGQRSYSFQLIVPPTCPSSFEGSYGYVRYVCKAIIDRPWKFDHESKAAFTVVSLLDLNNEPTNLSQPVQAQESKEVSCCCCVSGEISATLRLNKTGFVPGENLVINAEIKNDSNSSIDKNMVAIKQYTEFYGRSDSLFSSGELKPKCESEEVTHLKRDPIPEKQTDIWDNVQLRIPPLPPSRLVGCNIINISYVLKFYVSTYDEIKLVSDLVIGTIPLRENVAAHSTWYSGITSQPTPLPPPGAPPPADASAPPAPGAFDLPPPSYEECVKGPRQIRDDGDSQYMRGQLTWAPSYPTYNFDSYAAPSQVQPSANDADAITAASP